MTHIMVPDGVLAPWLWIAGSIGAAVCLGLALWSTRNSDRSRLVPLAAVLGAVMALVMSIEIAPLAYEPHLTVLSGILLGPAYGLLAVFVFNVLRMLFGDGAVTLLGLNTLLLGLEAVLGYYLFRVLARIFGARGTSSVGIAAGVATVGALAVSTLAFLAVVAVGSVPLNAVVEEGVLARVGSATPGFGAFATTLLLLGALGWLFEGVVVGVIVAFLGAVRPSYLPLPAARKTNTASAAPPSSPAPAATPAA